MKMEMRRDFEGESNMLHQRLEAMEERLNRKYHCKTEWIDLKTMTIGAPGVRGRVDLEEHALRVELDLSPVLRPLRSRIERELSKEIDTVVRISA